MNIEKEKEFKIHHFIQGPCDDYYYSIPFEVPKGVEKLEIENENLVDMALVDPDGKQIGASLQKYSEIKISEVYATPGYVKCAPKAGTWQIIACVGKVGEEGKYVDFEVEMKFKKRRWLKGDCHLHTYHSDGKYSPEKLISMCKKKGFDYMIITDHNTNSVGHTWPTKEGILIIQGEELTTKLGHINFWGVEKPFSGSFAVNGMEDMMCIVEEAKANGATASVNHPTCKKCTWLLPLDDFPLDCVEVWNGPMRIDNMTAIEWWHKELLKGRRIGAVGGSDYHNDYVVTDFLGNPCTIVLAESNTTDDVLRALREGRSVITHDPDSTMIYLTCGEAQLGDTVEWKEGIKADLKVKKLKKGHRLVVYNNDEIIYDYTASKTGDHEARVEVKEKGFIRAQITYTYNAITNKGYDLILKFIMPLDLDLPRPAFAWCLTNPIYFE